MSHLHVAAVTLLVAERFILTLFEALTIMPQYMVILFLVFLIQFSVSIACLSLGDNARKSLIEKSWDHSNDQTLKDIQTSLECCHLTSPIDNHTHSLESCKSVSGLELIQTTIRVESVGPLRRNYQ